LHEQQFVWNPPAGCVRDAAAEFNKKKKKPNGQEEDGVRTIEIETSAAVDEGGG